MASSELKWYYTAPCEVFFAFETTENGMEDFARKDVQFFLIEASDMRTLFICVLHENLGTCMLSMHSDNAGIFLSFPYEHVMQEFVNAAGAWFICEPEKHNLLCSTLRDTVAAELDIMALKGLMKKSLAAVLEFCSNEGAEMTSGTPAALGMEVMEEEGVAQVETVDAVAERRVYADVWRAALDDAPTGVPDPPYLREMLGRLQLLRAMSAEVDKVIESLRSTQRGIFAQLREMEDYIALLNDLMIFSPSSRPPSPPVGVNPLPERGGDRRVGRCRGTIGAVWSKLLSPRRAAGSSRGHPTYTYHCFPAVHTLPGDTEEDDSIMYAMVVLICAQESGGVVLVILAEEYIDVLFARRVEYEWTLHAMPTPEQIQVTISDSEMFWLEFMEEDHLEQFVRLFEAGQQDSFELALHAANHIILI
ncbi:hypothetical protein C8T65DRAFT_747243 [Cerioporus squamosus]|nr:hypothetical protein C8T65DRAFT_747243 [Cerioporus squamosus]